MIYFRELVYDFTLLFFITIFRNLKFKCFNNNDNTWIDELLNNEEEVRSKVVIPWLRSHGFTDHEFCIESSFNIQLGRNAFRIMGANSFKEAPENAKPRIDVLVKSSEGLNLFVIEVKHPRVSLNDKSYKQAISYGRLLDSGGMAPFVVVTNGKNSKVYCTFTGEEVSSKSIKTKSINFNFKNIIDGLKLKNDALLQLLHLSNENLLQFSELQVKERMQILYNESIHSWEKYIPKLYVSREKEENSLRSFIESDKKVTLVTAAPQIGKTNFLCHMATSFLSEGIPCLFFPAIGLDDNLVNSIASDFSWEGAAVASPITFIRDNLRSITEKQKLVIFIDGLNEVSSSLISSINSDASKLQNLSLNFVISCTWSSIKRVLSDQNNAPYFSKQLGMTKDLLERIDVESEVVFGDTPIIQLKEFSEDERLLAFNKYSKEYKVKKLSDSSVFAHPYSLRLAMQHYSGNVQVSDIDIEELLHLKIKDKANRCCIFSDEIVFSILKRITERMIELSSASVSADFILELNLVSGNEFNRLYDSGILARIVNEKSMSEIVFYDEMERDFITAIHYLELDEKKSHNIKETLSKSFKTYVGSSAIRWFCILSEEFCELCLECIQSNDADLCTFVISSIRQNKTFVVDEIQYLNLFDKCTVLSSPRLTAEILQFGVELDIQYNEIIESLNEAEQEVLIQGLLSIDTEDIKPEGYFSSIFEALTSSHYQAVGNDEDQHSAITSILENNVISQNKNNSLFAAKLLAYINPEMFVGIYITGITNKSDSVFNERAINELAEIIMNNLHGRYYGDMCPGMMHWLESSEPEDSLYEYEKLQTLCPLIFNSTHIDTIQDFKSLLDKLKTMSRGAYDEEDILEETDIICKANKDQLKLEF